MNVPQEHMQNLSGNNLLFNVAMVDLAKRLGYVKKDRIFIQGGSAGGYMTLMLSIIQSGILGAGCQLGITNMLYEQRYISYNNRFNEEYKASLPDERKNDLASFPIPLVKICYDLINDTGVFLGEEDSENCLLKLFSPVTHMAEINHPVVFYHSSADVMVPINQLTEKYIFRKHEEDLPADFKSDLRDFSDIPGLNVPLADLIPPEDIEVFILTPDDTKIKFNPDKQYNLNIMDEGGKSRLCAHFKNPHYQNNESEMEYIIHYMDKKTSETNLLSVEKLQALVQRYGGNMPLLLMQNPHKKNTEPHIYGSIASDRLDVLISIALYLGIDVDMEYQSTDSFEYSKENLAVFAELYAGLDKSLRFIDGDADEKGIGSDMPVTAKIIELIKHYKKLCCIDASPDCY